MSVFGENLKRFRVLAGISGKDFAKKLNIPYNSYMNYENKDNEPKYAILCDIADKLGVTVDELVRDHSGKKKRTQLDVSAANADNDTRFEKLYNLMADAGFIIKKDKKGKPDSKYGERILITCKDFLPPKVKADYLNRMYILIEAILHKTDEAAKALFTHQIFYHYEDASRGFLLHGTPAGVLLQDSEKLFASEIEPKNVEEIQAIAEGRAENPLLRDSKNKKPPTKRRN